MRQTNPPLARPTYIPLCILDTNTSFWFWGQTAWQYHPHHNLKMCWGRLGWLSPENLISTLKRITTFWSKWQKKETKTVIFRNRISSFVVGLFVGYVRKNVEEYTWKIIYSKCPESLVNNGISTRSTDSLKNYFWCSLNTNCFLWQSQILKKLV